MFPKRVTNIFNFVQTSSYKKLSWCWQTCATRLEVSQGHQTWYRSIF